MMLTSTETVIAGRWCILLGVAVSLILWSVPVGAASPCDSETVIPEPQEVLRLDCEALWAFYTNLDDPDNPNSWLPTSRSPNDKD